MQLGDVDLPSPRPLALASYDDNQFVVVERLDIEVGHKLWIFQRPPASRKNKVKFPVPEFFRE